MKKGILCLVLSLLLIVPANAFVYSIEILTPEQIHKLSDKELEDHYIEAQIEKKASGEFHEGAGFSSKKDYDKRKELLRYIFDLRREISNRENMQVDSIDAFLD